MFNIIAFTWVVSELRLHIVARLTGDRQMYLNKFVKESLEVQSPLDFFMQTTPSARNILFEPPSSGQSLPRSELIALQLFLARLRIICSVCRKTSFSSTRIRSDGSFFASRRSLRVSLIHWLDTRPLCM